MFPVSADDVLDKLFLQDSNEFDVIQVVKHNLTLRNFISTSKCSVLIQNDPSNAIDPGRLEKRESGIGNRNGNRNRNRNRNRNGKRNLYKSRDNIYLNLS